MSTSSVDLSPTIAALRHLREAVIPSVPEFQKSALEYAFITAEEGEIDYQICQSLGKVILVFIRTERFDGQFVLRGSGPGLSLETNFPSTSSAASLQKSFFIKIPPHRMEEMIQFKVVHILASGSIDWQSQNTSLDLRTCGQKTIVKLMNTPPSARPYQPGDSTPAAIQHLRANVLPSAHEPHKSAFEYAFTILEDPGIDVQMQQSCGKIVLICIQLRERLRGQLTLRGDAPGLSWYTDLPSLFTDLSKFYNRNFLIHIPPHRMQGSIHFKAVNVFANGRIHWQRGNNISLDLNACGYLKVIKLTDVCFSS